MLTIRVDPQACGKEAEVRLRRTWIGQTGHTPEKAEEEIDVTPNLEQHRAFLRKTWGDINLREGGRELRGRIRVIELPERRRTGLPLVVTCVGD